MYILSWLYLQLIFTCNWSLPATDLYPQRFTMMVVLYIDTTSQQWTPLCSLFCRHSRQVNRRDRCTQTWKQKFWASYREAKRKQFKFEEIFGGKRRQCVGAVRVEYCEPYRSVDPQQVTGTLSNYLYSVLCYQKSCCQERKPFMKTWFPTQNIIWNC